MDYETRLREDFKQYVIDCFGDGLGKALTPEQWLTGYLDSVGDMIAGDNTLAVIVNEAKALAVK